VPYWQILRYVRQSGGQGKVKHEDKEATSGGQVQVAGCRWQDFDGQHQADISTLFRNSANLGTGLRNTAVAHQAADRSHQDPKACKCLSHKWASPTGYSCSVLTPQTLQATCGQPPVSIML